MKQIFKCVTMAFLNTASEIKQKNNIFCSTIKGDKHAIDHSRMTSQAALPLVGITVLNGAYTLLEYQIKRQIKNKNLTTYVKHKTTTWVDDAGSEYLWVSHELPATLSPCISYLLVCRNGPVEAYLQAIITI